MNLTIFSDAPFGDRDAFHDFLLAHLVHHQFIGETLARQAKNASNFPLDADPHDDKDWPLTHFAMHQDIAVALNLADLPDISAIDFDDEEAYYDWMQTHAFIHAQINTALGIM